MIRPKYESPPKPTKAQSRAAYEAVTERSGGVCEGCSVGSGSQRHHRVFRSHGGTETIANLLVLCLTCHQQAHTPIGYQRGWAVYSHNDPEMVPTFNTRNRTWSRQGEPIDAQSAVEYMQAVGQIRTGMVT